MTPEIKKQIEEKYPYPPEGAYASEKVMKIEMREVDEKRVCASFGYSLASKELEEKEKKIEFYREATDKVRRFIWERSDIGEPNQPLFNAIADKLEEQQKEIERLKGLLEQQVRLRTIDDLSTNEDHQKSLADRIWNQFKEINNL